MVLEWGARHSAAATWDGWPLRNFATRLLLGPGMGSLVSAVFRGRVPCLRFPGPRVRLEGTPPSHAAAVFFGVYEGAEIRFIHEDLRRDLDVVELGSSIGVVASHLVRHLEPGRRVICVEANPDLLPLLEKNVRANALSAEPHFVHAAIDYEHAEVSLVTGMTNLGGRTVGRDVAGRRTHRVPTTTLGSLVERFDLGAYALVSDIEGAEWGFVRNDRKALEGCRQLVLEMHGEREGDETKVDELARIVSDELGFVLRKRHGPVGFFERR